MQPGAINSNNELIGGGFLCVGCIEKRLGRRLRPKDFQLEHTFNRNLPGTPRLLNRQGRKTFRARSQTDDR